MNAREDLSEVANITWLAGRYQIARLRARGALSLVYHGQDAVLQRPVAIKMPLAEHADEYRATLELTATLAHPAFLALYDVVEQDNRLFLIYEFVEGRPLTDYVSAGLPVRRALALALQITRALAYAHARGVTHGDLTPAAVIVDRSAVARVANLGLPPDGAYFDDVAASAFQSEVADDPEVTAAGLVEAEQARFDVWAIASALWLLVTDVTPATLASAAAEQVRTYRADTPQELRAAIERTLRVSHSQPIVTVEALAAELDAIQRELDLTADAETDALPERLAMLRARATAPNGAPTSLGRVGPRASDQRERAAAAITSYDSREAELPADDPHQTNPSNDHDWNADYAGGEAYAARAPRLTLPARAPQRWPDSSDATIPDRSYTPVNQTQAPASGLGPWIWALVSLAIFALCFAAGFVLAPALVQR